MSGCLDNFKSDLDAHLLSYDLLQNHGFNFILLYVAVFLNTKNQFKTFIFPKSENLIALKYLKNFIYNWK